MPRAPSRRALLLSLALVALAAGGLAGRFACPRPAPEPLDSPEALLAALRAAGSDYVGAWVHDPPDRDQSFRGPGFYLKRASDSRPYAALAIAHASRPLRKFVYIPSKASTAPGVRLGKMLLTGDPDEIERVLDALR